MHTTLWVECVVARLVECIERADRPSLIVHHNLPIVGPVPAALAEEVPNEYRPAVRLYLNTSALHRPFDDLSQGRIREEAEAVTMIVSALKAGRVDLVSSEYLVFEVTQNPSREQVEIMLATLSLAQRRVTVSRHAARRAEELEGYGLRGLDAIHIACAESGGADLLVTTDDRMLRSSRRAGLLRVQVVAPFEAVTKINEELQ